MLLAVLASVAGIVLLVSGERFAGRSPASDTSVLPAVPATAMNLIVKPSNNSPLLVADPTDHRFVVLANRVDGPDFSCGLQVSGDGGRSWLTANPVATLPDGAEKCYAPEVAFDGEGQLYYLFIGLQGPGNSPMGAFLTTSADRGRSFSPPRQILGPDRYMVRMALDPEMGENGRIHLVWLEARSDPPLGGLPAPPNPIMAAHSDDRGETFTTPVQLSDPQRKFVVSPVVAIGRDHNVHVVYYDLEDDFRDYQGLEGPTWQGTWSLVATTSIDGGRTFGSSSVVDAGVVPPERVMLIFTMPPPSLVADDAGHLYVAWYDARNGDWDVLLRRSVDGGRSWGDLRRINDDPEKNGSHQYLPRLSVAPGGRLDAIFYDRRDNVENRGNDVYYSFSVDGGLSFAPNIKLTALSSDSRIGPRYAVPSALGLFEFGSRLALISEPNSALAAWTDTTNTGRGAPSQDIFATEVLLRGDRRTPVWVRSAGTVLVAVGFAALAFHSLGGRGDQGDRC